MSVLSRLLTLPWRGMVSVAAVPLGIGAVAVVGYVIGSSTARTFLPAPSADGSVILQDSPLALRDYADCVAKGFPIEETDQGRRCHAPDGQILVQEVPTQMELKLRDPGIVQLSPTQDQVVGTAFTLKGLANIYQHPLTVRVYQDGEVIQDLHATAQTSPDGNYGPFQVSVTLPNDGPDAFLLELQGVRDETGTPVGPFRTGIRRSATK